MSEFLNEDIPCVSCGYNLRGLTEAGHCPECHASVRDARTGNSLRHADECWLQDLYKGQTLLCISFVGCPLLVIVVALLNLLPIPTGLGQLTSVEVLLLGLNVLAVVNVIGAYRLTEQDPQQQLIESPASLRCFIRLLAVGTSLVLLVRLSLPETIRFLQLGPAVQCSTAQALDLLVPILFSTLLILGSFHLASIAKRIPAYGLGRRTKQVAIPLALCLLLWVLGRCVAQSTSLLRSDLNLLLALLSMGMALAPLMGLIFFVRMSNVLSTYRREFNSALESRRDTLDRGRSD